MGSPPVYSTRFKIVAALVLAGATTLFVLAALAATGGGDDPVLSSGDAGDYVESLLPPRNSQVPRQTTVGIDLVTGWDGTLVLNDVEIPADELDSVPELGLIQFTPGEGRAVEELQAGRNCVTAVVWPLSEGRENGARTVPTWCFEAV